MDWLLSLLFGWWWYGRDGQRKSADAADRYVLPVLLVIAGICLIILLVLALR